MKEIEKSEYQYVRARALKEMGETIQALTEGKTKEEMEKEAKGTWKKKIMGLLVPALMIGLSMRFVYTKSQ